jgi:hypothetical protein
MGWHLNAREAAAVITKTRTPGRPPGGRAATRPSVPVPEDRQGGHRQEALDPEVDDATWIAQRIVLDAGVQAVRLRRQASAQTATICEAAEREAEEIRRRASMQAAAIREAAEREAAELRAIVTAISAESSDRAGADDSAAAKTATSPSRPAVKPAARKTSNTKGRQARAMRKVAAAAVVLSLLGAATGAVEIELHGLSFFLFRNAGAGAGNSRDLDEDQGPGQPDAPKPHHPVVTQGGQGRPSPRGSAAHGK